MEFNLILCKSWHMNSQPLPSVYFVYLQLHINKRDRSKGNSLNKDLICD